jgi:mRNA-degrading endonuclease RelE of RelBE toxin-antitoxin system
MAWTVVLSVNVRKSLKRLPQGINEIFQLLLAEMKLAGPVQTQWPHYGKLRQDCHHCHLQRGRPTYVAVWRVMSKEDKVI